MIAAHLRVPLHFATVHILVQGLAGPAGRTSAVPSNLTSGCSRRRPGAF